MTVPVFFIYDVCQEVDRHTNQGATNHPEKRQHLIREELERSGYKGVSNDKQIAVGTLKSLRVHHEDYLNWLPKVGRSSNRQAWPSANEAQDLHWFIQGELVPSHFSNVSFPLPRTPVNYKTLMDGRIPLFKLCGLFGNDTMSPIVATTWQLAAQSAHNSYAAAEAVASAGARLVYALNSSPGHHAGPAAYSGYCFLNNSAVAARALQHLRPGAKVAVLDLDYHFGNGTMDIFWEDPSVLTISLHCHPALEYPSFSDEIGAGAGEGFNRNFPLGKGTAWPAYLAALTEAVHRIREFGADFLVVAFGADTYKDDPDVSPLDIPDYAAMGSLLAGLGLPAVVTQEGGYCIAKVPEIVRTFLDSLGKKQH